MSKEYYRIKIADRRKDIVSLRAKIVKIKDEKKRRIASLTHSIKNTTSKSSKETYRKQKIAELAKYDKEQESIKKKIEGLKKEIEAFRASLANSK
jgi:hypothetical protein